MGGLVAKLVFKNGKEAVSSEYTTLWDIAAKDIDGNQVERLGSLYGEKKATLVVNVATA